LLPARRGPRQFHDPCGGDRKDREFRPRHSGLTGLPEGGGDHILSFPGSNTTRAKPPTSPSCPVLVAFDHVMRPTTDGVAKGRGLYIVIIDYGGAKTRCDVLLNPQFDAWRKREVVDLSSAYLTTGTFDWMIATYKSSPLYRL
jgi:hypothetical protein